MNTGKVSLLGAALLVVGASFSARGAHADPFPSEQAILTTTNIPAMLATLRAQAQPTSTYHQQLVQVAQDAKSIDSAHLNLLVNACYYTFEQLQAAQTELAQLSGKTDPASLQEAQKDEQLILSAQPLESYANQIIDLGVPKLTDLNSGTGMALLQRLNPVGGADDAFNAVLKVISPIALNQEINFVDLAVSKGEDAIGGQVALDWFKRQPDHSLSALSTLDNHLKADGRDVLVTGAMAVYFQSPSVATVEALSSMAYYDSVSIIMTGENEINPIAVSDIIALSADVSGSNRDQVVTQGMNRISMFTTDQIIQLAGAAYYNATSILLNFTSRISDYTEANAIKLSAAVSGSNKDTEIANYMATQSSFTTQELEQLSASSYYNATSILLDNLDKLTDFTLANMLSIDGLLSGSNRDTLTSSYLSKHNSFMTSDLLQISGASYYNSSSILMNYLTKVSDLNLQNFMKIDSLLSGSNRDTAVATYISLHSQFSTADILALSGAAYYNASSVLLNNIADITDLTVANALEIVGNLSGSNRDTYLLTAVNDVTDLSLANLPSLADAAYYDADQVTAAGKKRLGQ